MGFLIHCKGNRQTAYNCSSEQRLIVQFYAVIMAHHSICKLLENGQVSDQHTTRCWTFCDSTVP